MTVALVAALFGVWVLCLAFVWALCRAAADGDVVAQTRPVTRGPAAPVEPPHPGAAIKRGEGA